MRSWLTPHPNHFTPRTSVAIVQETQWVPVLIQINVEKRKPLVPLGFESQTVQPVASHYSDNAIPQPTLQSNMRWFNMSFM